MPQSGYSATTALLGIIAYQVTPLFGSVGFRTSGTSESPHHDQMLLSIGEDHYFSQEEGKGLLSCPTSIPRIASEQFYPSTDIAGISVCIMPSILKAQGKVLNSLSHAHKTHLQVVHYLRSFQTRQSLPFKLN